MKDSKAEKGHKQCHRGVNIILDKMAKKSLTGKVIFEHTNEEDERMDHTDMKEKQLFIMRE